jgi:hypothetical protein
LFWKITWEKKLEIYLFIRFQTIWNLYTLLRTILNSIERIQNCSTYIKRGASRVRKWFAGSIESVLFSVSFLFYTTFFTCWQNSYTLSTTKIWCRFLNSSKYKRRYKSTICNWYRFLISGFENNAILVKMKPIVYFYLDFTRCSNLTMLKLIQFLFLLFKL